MAELEEESDCDNLSIDDVYDSDNDVSYNPEDLSSDCDSEGCDEPFEKETEDVMYKTVHAIHFHTFNIHS